MQSFYARLINLLPGDGFFNKALAIQCTLYAATVIALVLVGVDVTYSDSSNIKWVGIGLLAIVAYSAVLGLSKRLQERYLNGRVVSHVNNLTVLQGLAFAIGSGVAEEVVFRGFLQTHLGLVVASVLFGLVHWDKTVKVYPLVTGVIGLLLGLVTIASGSLVPAIVIHVVNNFVAFMYARVEGRKLREAMVAKARELRRERDAMLDKHPLIQGFDDLNNDLAQELKKVKALREELRGTLKELEGAS